MNEIANATVDLDAGEILGGGTPIQNSLSLITDGAALDATGATYTTANTLAVDGGTITLSRETFSPAGIVLAAGANLLQGNGTVSGAIDNQALILANASGLLDLAGTVSGAGSLEIARDSTLELAQGNSENVLFDPIGSAFSSLGDVLRLDQPGSYTGTLAGFATGVQGGSAFPDQIYLPGFAPGTLTDSFGGGVLTIESGGSIVSKLNFAGPQNGFTLVPDGGSGTFIEALGPPIFESGNHGDWGAGSIWNTGTAPNAAADYVYLQTQVTIGLGESSAAGTLDISETDLFATVVTTLNDVGTLDVADFVTVEFEAALAMGAPGNPGFLATPGIASAGHDHRARSRSTLAVA